jgi:hypothetical protein
MSVTTTPTVDQVASGRTGWPSHLQSPVIRGALAMIVVNLGFRAWVVFGGWYVGDDFAFISRMLNRGLSPGVAVEGYGGHLMPAPMYLSWLFNEISPYSWWITASFLLLLQAVAAIGLLRLLVVMFGVRPGILPPLALYLFTIFTVPVAVWWAAGANQLPLQVSLFFGMANAVKYLRQRRTVDLALAIAWVLLGLLFYEKCVLIFAAYGVVALSWFATGSFPERVGQVWRSYRPAVVVCAAMSAGYLFVYSQAALNFSPGAVNETPVAPVVGNMVIRAWLSGIVGGPLRWDYAEGAGALANPSDFVVLLSAAALALLIREVRRTRRHGTNALFLPGFFLLADVLLVTAGRSSFVGAQIALEYRYQGELAAVTAIALGCAVLPIRGAVDQVVHVRDSALFDDATRVGLVCAVVCTLGLISSTQYVAHWHHGDFAKRYFSSALADLERESKPIALVDGQVPNEILWALGYPTNTHSHLLRQFPQARFVDVATDQLHTIASDGRVLPVQIPPVRTSVARPQSSCDYRVSTKGAEIPLTGAVAFGGWWVRIGYFASARSPVVVRAGGKEYHTMIEPGLHSLYFAAGPEVFDSVAITGIQDGATLCTDDVAVGRPEPVTIEQP